MSRHAYKSMLGKLLLGNAHFEDREEAGVTPFRWVLRTCETSDVDGTCSESCPFAEFGTCVEFSNAGAC